MIPLARLADAMVIIEEAASESDQEWLEAFENWAASIIVVRRFTLQLEARQPRP